MASRCIQAVAAQILLSLELQSGVTGTVTPYDHLNKPSFIICGKRTTLSTGSRWGKGDVAALVRNKMSSENLVCSSYGAR
ncbi:hypothetical protein EJ04DRAFT_38918 [Polyplosphaeria fusca]|uniref:Secreted protein n=1 Tax=Polyplosphaeria fusca TaxID=682080 RepID=A0A9P4QT92_9PLEO|nr:hypothetical protein EJ04DRAFT_38918 [Polyplosphaeria fusca]